VPFREALQNAQERGVDLIQVTEKVDPPVCRLGDYGKYLYQQEKKNKEAKKSTGSELKEVRLTYNMSPHDLETRAKQAVKFLQKGHRVRLTLPLRGRQKALEGYARDKVATFLASLTEQLPAKAERELKREPRGLSMIIAKA
jgi:translation initiation factor IF-3